MLTDPPARAVGGGRNVIGRYPSRKVGMTIQFESRTCEFALVNTVEVDAACLTYRCQPTNLTLKFTIATDAGTSRKCGQNYVPDFLVIYRDRGTFYQSKLHDEVEALCVTKPYLYSKVGDRFICPPADDAAKEIGLEHQIITERDLHSVLRDNAANLQRYFSTPHLEINGEITARILEIIQTSPGMTIRSLLDEMPDLDVSDLHRLLLSGKVFIDLFAAPLHEIERVRLFPDALTASCFFSTLNTGAEVIAPSHIVAAIRPGNQLQIDGVPYFVDARNAGTLTICSITGGRKILRLSDIRAKIAAGAIVPHSESALSQRAYDVLRKASPEALSRAFRRLGAIDGSKQRNLTGLPQEPDHVPARTLFDWRVKYKHAQRTYGHGLIGLIARDSQKGNRTPRTDAQNEALVQGILDQHFASSDRPNSFVTYGKYTAKAIEVGYPPISLKTFYIRIRSRNRQSDTRAREGDRVAQAEAPPYWLLEYDTPIHGTRALQYGHYDLTQLDILVICLLTGRILGKPWLGLLQDAYTRRVLSFALTFEKETALVLLSVLRECSRRHGRAPENIILDQGATSRSHCCDDALASYHIGKLLRPPHTPRSGATLERFFGATHTRAIYGIPGNTQALKRVRVNTAEIDPNAKAIAPLEYGAKWMHHYFYETFDTTTHPAIATSPRSAHELSIERNGSELGREMPFDSTLMLLTMPEMPSKPVIKARYGIRFQYKDYFHPTMVHADGMEVPGRYDPDDISKVLAYIDSQWRVCTCRNATYLQGRTAAELAVLSQTLRQGDKLAHGETLRTALTLGSYWKMVDGDIAILRERARLRAMQVVAGTASTDDVIPDQTPTAKTDEPKAEPKFTRYDHVDACADW